MADNTHTSTTNDTAPTATLTLANGAQQAAAAFEQGAITAQLTAAQEQAAAQAARDAKAAKRAADAKAAAARKAAWRAKERAAAAKAAAAKAAAAQAATPATPVAAKVSTAAPAATTAAATPTATPTVAAASSSKADQLIAFLKAQIGKPYVYGATGPSSYDCSGLTQAAFASIGITIPRTSEEQSTFGTPVSLSALQPGDLIFWGGEGSAYHVGVFIGNGQYLDAANPSSPVGIKNLVDYEPDWAVRAI
ncbi:Cell wall-associated hydrolase, NlpC family [Streptomyces sp. DvalAA-14]|uniref:C40 family peptidase n=1 Tax=unclassified Streptomyces TaxID=2593676 RepID=UPI00081B6BFE|nr:MULTISPECIES: C40 family peptidase [unclassified Streptomyces]SCE19871.1 Cell wall-associated hydrolase, NlpC family [Streptomyces sp. DvalAA-14]